MEYGLIWKIKQLNYLIEKFSRLHLKALDLTVAQAIVLNGLLKKKERQMCAKDLHLSLGMSKSFISTTLKSLKQKGYVKIQDDRTDDRKKMLRLTQQALFKEQEIVKSIRDLQLQLEQAIAPDHLVWLEEDLDNLLTDLKKKQKGRREENAENITSANQAI